MYKRQEQIWIQGSPPRIYHSLHEYLDIMSLPTAYAGYIEMAAAQQIYNINIEVVVAGNILPPPQPPPQNTLHVLFNPHSLHYSTLRTVPNHAASLTIRGFSCITPRVCGFRHSEGGSSNYQKLKNVSYVTSRISSKLIFATFMGYFDRAYYGHYVTSSRMLVLVVGDKI